MDFILIALLVAMAALGGRALRRWVQRQGYEKMRAATPGYSADHPAVLSSAKVIDETVDAARCVCGGRVRNFGETTRLGLRVVRGRCRECDADVDLYFVLPRLLN